MLIGQAGQLELFDWSVRAHWSNSGDELSTAGADAREQAARGRRRDAFTLKYQRVETVGYPLVT